MTVSEVAAFLRIKRSTVYSLMLSSDLPFYQVGGKRIVKQSELEEWLGERRR